MRFTLHPITEPDAREISGWHYEEPYSIYDGDPAAVPSLLDERFAYHSVRDERGELVGYFCFGEDAQIPEGRQLGLYNEDALDIGLGMKPDLTGKGIGPAFVSAGLQYTRQHYAPAALRLTVAAFNERAIRAYQKAGFESMTAFGGGMATGGREWLLMLNHPGPNR